jgi:hypothetical protein
MTVSVAPRDMGKPTLAQAVQGTRTGPTNMTNGAPPRQPDTIETPPVEAAATPTPEKKDDFLSPKFAALARQEKQIRAANQKLKAEKEAFEAEKQARLNGYIPKDKLKSDPLAAFQDAGLSYDDVTQHLLNAPQGQVDPTVRALQQQVQDLTSKLSQFTQKQEETQTTAYKQAVETIRHKVKGLVDSSPEFEAIKALDQSEAVVALIEETFKAEGYVMTEEEAAREVEEHLIEESLRMAGLEKVKKKLAPAPVEEAPKVPTTAPQKQVPQQQQLRTLTNAVSTASTGRLTERQRRERAILAAQGKLNT